METVIYDGSFEGWLTAVFTVFEHRFRQARISNSKDFQQSMFGKEFQVTTDEMKAQRVWKGLEQRLSKSALHQL
ncbi:MAG TPA: DNA metabolism protein, partial [Chitinophagaceae bacterium]|nr:DNA metabolism protein [Chitinophagaceae bacterium]